MFDWFLHLEYLLYLKYGYDFVVHLEDFLLCTSSFFLGWLVCSISSGRVLLRIQKVPIDPEGKKNKKIQWVFVE